MNNGGWYQQNPYGGYGQAGDFRGNAAGQGYGQNPYWGQNAGQALMPTVQQNQPMGLYDVIGQGTRVDWVQGEAAAKCYAVRPGMSVILFDMDNPNRVYVKAYNMAGAPIYTAGFDLGEIKLGQPAQLNDERYVPREEYEKSMNQIAKLFASLTESKGEQYERQTEPAARMGHEPERTAERNEPGTGFPGV